jgi:hypothetical protein
MAALPRNSQAGRSAGAGPIEAVLRAEKTMRPHLDAVFLFGALAYTERARCGGHRPAGVHGLADHRQEPRPSVSAPKPRRWGNVVPAYRGSRECAVKKPKGAQIGTVMSRRAARQRMQDCVAARMKEASK